MKTGDHTPPAPRDNEHARLIAAFLDLGRVREGLVARSRLAADLEAIGLPPDVPTDLPGLDKLMAQVAPRLDAKGAP